MTTLYNILLGISVFVAIAFAFLVFVTGKGDAMSGGSSVRTSYKGKANFEDHISKMTLILGISFIVLMIILDVISNRMSPA